MSKRQGMPGAQKTWARWAGLSTTAFLTAVFAWRSTVSWLAVQEGQSKLLAAVLITAMGIASVATLYVLRPSSAHPRVPARAPSR